MTFRPGAARLIRVPTKTGIDSPNVFACGQWPLKLTEEIRRVKNWVRQNPSLRSYQMLGGLDVWWFWYVWNLLRNATKGSR